jgi:glycosyltransferase involved in cell wall biosynthesis
MMGVKPKLLLFSHLCSAGYITGAEKLLILFAKEWSRHFQCVLVVPREGVIAAQARALGMQVIVFDIPLNTALYFASSHAGAHLLALKNQFVYQRLLALLVRERPSCVFVNTVVHPLPAVAAKSLGIPVIWSLMEAIRPSPYRKLTLDIIAGASDIISGISQTVLEPFKQHPAMAKTAILTPYVDQDGWNPAAWPHLRAVLRNSQGWTEHECVFGFVTGTIYPQKGLEAFVRAAIKLKKDLRARFFVAGNPVDMDYWQACQALVHQAGMEDRFRWLRFEENLELIYPAMDVVVVPSMLPEGFGMTALEAMMFGKPVIAFASGGLTEILEATGNGQLLVSPGNVSGLASQMQWLMDNPGIRHSIGEHSRVVAQSVFGVHVLRFQQDLLVTRLPILPNPPSPLVRGSGKTVYLLENGRRRPFRSQNAFLQRGFRFEDVRKIPDHELRRYRLGPPIADWKGSRSSSGRNSRRKIRKQPGRAKLRRNSRLNKRRRIRLHRGTARSRRSSSRSSAIRRRGPYRHRLAKSGRSASGIAAARTIGGRRKARVRQSG